MKLPLLLTLLTIVVRLYSPAQAREIPAGAITHGPPQPAVAAAKNVAAFMADCAAKAGAAEKAYKVAVAGREGWLFFAPELHHVGAGRFWGQSAAKASRALEPENVDPLPAILDFKSQLDRAGIELLLVPLPPKSTIYPDMASAKIINGSLGVPRVDVYHQEFYELLRQKGVTVLDMAPEFLTTRHDKRAAPLYCRTDTHWAGTACVLTARRIAALLKDRPWLAGVPKLQLQQQWKSTAILGDLTKIEEGKTPPKETLSLRFISITDKGRPKPVAPNRASPIVLLGDSHNLVFSVGEDMHARSAGLPDQLAFELGVAVDLLAVRGSGATPARTLLLQRARADAKYLSRKKLVIWCFSAREFTESSGWQKVPVVR